MFRFNLACAAACVSLTVGCRPSATAVPTVERPVVAPVDAPQRRFAYTALDGTVVSSATLRGRMTVVAFVTSYDAASQAQARFLKKVARSHVPRLNVLLLVLEPRGHEPIVRAFADALQLSFPVALADEATIRGEGEFTGMQHVPAVVLLDRKGREVWRHLGLIRSNRLSREITRRDAAAAKATPQSAADATR